MAQSGWRALGKAPALSSSWADSSLLGAVCLPTGKELVTLRDGSNRRDTVESQGSFQCVLETASALR
jgi:hypothetical protein